MGESGCLRVQFESKRKKEKGHIKEITFLCLCGSTLSAIGEGAVPALELCGG